MKKKFLAVLNSPTDNGNKRSKTDKEANNFLYTEIHIISHNEAELVPPYTLQQQVVSHEQTTGVQEC